MEIEHVLIIVAAVLILLLLGVFITSYVCYYRIFLSRREKDGAKKDSVTTIVGDGFKPFYPLIGEWNRQVAATPCREVSITSFDGLTLRGKYFEYEKGAPIELLMHGYKGSMKRDMSGGVVRCFKQGRSALCIDHRASGSSEGKTITFGINESRDCVDWINFIINDIDKDARIILTGVSMGAATAMITAGKELPRNVVAVLADCGYTSAREIIMNTMRDMKLPPKLLYPFAILGGRIFGHFNIDETSPIEMMKKCKLPVIFIHGDADDFVPYEMSVRNYNACASENKKLVTIEGAGHGVCFPVDQEKYLAALSEFFDPLLKDQ